MFDREAYVKALEEQEPLWEPGTKAAYHVHNQGYLLGEIDAPGHRQDRRPVPARGSRRARCTPNYSSAA